MLIPEDQLWMVIVGFIIAFVLAFGIGANDVANSFGTSVGAKVLTLRQACILATVCELAGAVLLGAKVSNTIRKELIDTELFSNLTNGVPVLMAGQVSALGGSCIWLLIATFFRLPVSGSHSIVGSVIGFSMVIFGFKAIQWTAVIKIVSSWFISPLLSGLTSVAMFYLMEYTVFKKESHLEPALKLLPGFYGTVVFINIFSIFYEGPPMLYFDRIPLYGVLILSFGCAVITILCVHFLLVPWIRKRFLKNSQEIELKQSDPPLENGEPKTFAEDGANAHHLENGSPIEEQKSKKRNFFDKLKRKKPMQFVLKDDLIEEIGTKHHENADLSNLPKEDFAPIDGVAEEDGAKETVTESGERKVDEEQGSTHDLEPPALVKVLSVDEQVFSFLQIITAVFGSFAHGGNDVSNAIGPLIGLWIIGVTQMVESSMPTPIWILFYGGLGISVGLWVWGRRVIQTIGEDLTQITPSSGVCIEIGSAVTVMIASKIGLPISTTHCKVGSVVGVGRARSSESVNWSIFRNILIAWLVTLPASGAISALLMYVFSFAV